MIEDNYEKLNSKFYEKTGIDIQKGTVIDSFMLSIADMIQEAYDEIENNKTPYKYTSISGENLDSIALFFGLSRKENESDKNFLYRITKWNTSNKASNLDAIETALINMTYCSHVTYIPYAYGCGTAAAYIIPKELTDEYKDLAIKETKNILSEVTSPSTYINYIIPEILPVKITILYKTSYAEINSIKNEINEQIINYINSIPTGDYLEIGYLNKLGINNNYINYFNVISVMINNVEIGNVSVLQKVESKFLIDKNNIIWQEAL